ncbi:uncharacterized protein LOC133171512 [Saccostrea echinata]|uniref:uncharacterized protein LOC133171512 n=1 Tax=Saccostrea echinata TaxID=191078 RepID=UPI002A8406CA|nr:uncharacterized protein LOC133171512 [Saccostrea echinata]
MPRGKKRMQVARQDQDVTNSSKRVRSSKKAVPPNEPNQRIPEQQASNPSQSAQLPSADEIAAALLKKIQNPSDINQPVTSTQSVFTTPRIDHPMAQTVTSQPPTNPTDLVYLVGNLTSRSTISQPVPSTSSLTSTAGNSLPSVSSVEGWVSIVCQQRNL